MEPNTAHFQIKTTAFQPGGSIPVNFTGDGPNKSPIIRWENPPAEAKSFALIVEDPDAPGEVFAHWLVYDIPADMTHLDPELPHDEMLPNGIKQGVNDFNEIGYSGPFPPVGKKHQYVFRLYALREPPGLNVAMRKDEFLAKIKDQGILAQSEVTGFYKSLSRTKKAV